MFLLLLPLARYAIRAVSRRRAARNGAATPAAPAPAAFGNEPSVVAGR
jgi:hypothetical protein